MNRDGAFRRGAAFLFGLYAGILFIGTHWPGVRIEGPIPRPDLFVHFGAFGTWTILMMLCRVWGPVASWRNVGWSVVAGLLYAAFDEGLQAIPRLHRVCAWDDFAANAGGVSIAAAIVLVVDRAWSAMRGR